MRWKVWRAVPVAIVLLVASLAVAGPVGAQNPGPSEPVPDGPPSADAGTPSTIVVAAGGSTGAEIVELAVNGETVATWTGLGRTPRPLTAEVTEPVEIEQLRVHFTNDRRRPGIDRNVVIDYVEIDGVRFESEAAANRSSGRWTRGDGCSEGYKRTEVLHCSGWIEYADAVGTTLAGSTDPVPVIFDTDMGPDIDDALALAMLHAYENEGRVEIEAVTVSRPSLWGARYSDLLNTWYGRPDIPIGVQPEPTPADGSDHNWSRPVVQTGRYDNDVHLDGPLPSGVEVMRQVLADADDGSVVIIQTGFAGNLADLLASGSDDLSPLTGEELVAAKVRLVSIMGGDNRAPRSEFNIANDIEAAQVVFDRTPAPIIQSEFGLGYGLLYPLASIHDDFGHSPDHPIPLSYLWSDLDWHDDEGDHYNMRSWDLTSVLAAVEPPERHFRVSEPGRVSVDDTGRTRFTPTADGNVVTLGHLDDYTEAERAAILDRLIDLVTGAG